MTTKIALKHLLMNFMRRSYKEPPRPVEHLVQRHSGRLSHLNARGTQTPSIYHLPDRNIPLKCPTDRDGTVAI